MRQQVERKLQQAPVVDGQVRSRWTLAWLRQAVPELKGLSLPGVCKILHRLGLRYKRGREHLHSPDPEYTSKLKRVQQLEADVRQSGGRLVLMYADELTYYRRPSLNRDYARCGHTQALVELGHSSNCKRRACAALDIRLGCCFTWQGSKIGKQELIRFFQQLAARYPDAEVIYVVLDNWPVHFLPEVVEAARQCRIELVRLPTYAPWTNPVEKVWLRLKREVLHHHRFADDWAGLVDRVQRWLTALDQPSTDLLHSVGLFPT